MSNLATAIGLTYESQHKLALSIGGLADTSKPVTAAMRHGIQQEASVRQWYAQSKGITVEEVGLAVPKWEERIGASLDGVVGEDGMLEIKCPVAIYPELLVHQNKVQAGWVAPEHYHEHIKLSHYAQMQGGMAVTARQWCDYLVCSTFTQQVYLERIYFNQPYWESVLRPGIATFLDKVVPQVLADARASI
jgi:hypothetical protein